MEITEPITLQTSEGQSHIVDRTVVEMSETIKDVIDDTGSENSIPLSQIDTQTFEQLVKYMTHHTKHPEDHLNHKDVLDDISEWDIEYCSNLDNELLFKVILACNYLDIKPLLQLTCKTVAQKIKGKTPDEIKKALDFKIEN